MTASYQQRIPLKGTEDSIEYFTNILKATKSEVGVNSAEVLLQSLQFWHQTGSGSGFSNRLKCSAHLRTSGVSRIFYLQVLTTSETMTKISTELDWLRREYGLKALLDNHNVGRAEFLLEALILIIESFKQFRPLNCSPTGTQMLNVASTTTSSSPSTNIKPTFERKPINKAVQANSTPHYYDNGISCRKSSEEPSISLAPARYGSVGRDQGFNFPTKSWRTMLREQQIVDNRKLLESVKRNYNYNLGNGTQCHDNKKYQWQPVHEHAIENHRKVYIDNDKNCRNVDRNNNSVNSNQECYRKPAILPQRRREKTEPPVQQTRSTHNEVTPKVSDVRKKYDFLANDGLKSSAPILTLKERQQLAETMASYLKVHHPDLRPTPGFQYDMSNFDRVREGVDCDEVYPNVILGNGATVKKKDYLKRIGITHILNAAEYRGVNVGKEYFNQVGDNFQYLGFRIEDTPQTQICRHFMDAVAFMDDALLNNGKIFVNCVFGKSRSTTFVVVYLMICQKWDALAALRHIRQKRPVQLNTGFLLQIVDLDYRLKWERMK